MKTFKYFMGFFALMVSVSLFVSCGDDDPIVDVDDPEEYKTDSTDNGAVRHTCPDTNHPHAIDLGLPSGTKWCCCNVGATVPEGYGDSYAWGETSVKDAYTWETYVYYDSTATSRCKKIGSDIAGTVYDVAKVKMGDTWQMPTRTQWKELIENCTRSLVVRNGITCMKVVGPNKNYIFLPEAGCYWDTILSKRGTDGFYWSSTLGTGYGSASYVMYFGSTAWDCDDMSNRFGGLSVRAVSK